MPDEIFDPEIHATDRDGNPSVNKDGSFRKKRKDAGGKSAKAATAPTGNKAADAQRAQYAKSVAGLLQLPATLLTLVDPVDGYCASELVQPWSNVLADLALEYPQLAAGIERVSAVGPLSGVIGLGLLTVAQFAHNHGKIPPHLAAMVGARPRTEIEKVLAQRGAQLAAEAEAQKAYQAEAQAMSDALRERDAAAEAAAEAAEAGQEHGYAAAV